MMMNNANFNVSAIANELYAITSAENEKEKAIYPLDSEYYISCHVMHGRSGKSAGLTLESKSAPVYGCVLSANSKGDKYNFDTQVLKMIQNYHNMKRSAEMNAIFC